MTFASGENVGPYRIVEQLGQGGMATVFRAYHPALDRDVAIKVLHSAIKVDPQFSARFKREAQIVATLEHPNIIPIYDFNDHNGEPYLVMRYISGQTLKAHMEQHHLQPDAVMSLMQPMCDGLAYAHDQGVLHRDIKPSNIMLADDGKLFLTDFGMARIMQMGESTLSQDMLLGTPQYISPEQAQGERDLDAQTDIYSLGIVLFEMLTGSVPFSGDTPFAVIHDHIYKPLPMPHTLKADIDPAAEKVILKALAKEPTDRFKTVREFWDALESALRPLSDAHALLTPQSSTIVEPVKPKANKWLPIAAVIGLLLMCVIVGALMLRGIRMRRQDAADLSAVTQDAQTEPVDQGAAGGDNTSAANTDESSGAADEIPSGTDTQSNTDQTDNAQTRAKLLFQAGETARERENYPQALNRYEAAIEADPTFLPPYYRAAELTIGEDPEQAVSYLEQALEDADGGLETLLQLGYAQVYAGDLQGAEESFGAAQQLSPDNALIYAGLARVAIANEDFETAGRYFTEAQSLDQDAPEVMLIQGFLLWKQNKLFQARRIYEAIQAQEDLSPIMQFELEKARQTLIRSSERNQSD